MPPCRTILLLSTQHNGAPSKKLRVREMKNFRKISWWSVCLSFPYFLQLQCPVSGDNCSKTLFLKGKTILEKNVVECSNHCFHFGKSSSKVKWDQRKSSFKADIVAFGNFYHTKILKTIMAHSFINYPSDWQTFFNHHLWA